MGKDICLNYQATGTFEKFHNSTAFVRGIKGPYGCYSGDTEYLTPTGWKRFDEYAESDLVAQWHKNGEIDFVKPRVYTKLPCDEFYHFKSDNLEMMLSPEHRIPYYDTSNNLSEIRACFLYMMIFVGEITSLIIPTPDNGKLKLTNLKSTSIEKKSTKYCFTVPSSYLVVRYKGKEFISGNSGKTTAMVAELFLKAVAMPCYHGTNLRRSRFVVLRASYPEIMGSTLETIKEFFPASLLQIKLGNKEVPSISIRFSLPDNTIVETKLQLFALELPQHVDKLGGVEYTGAFIDEAREISRTIFNAVTGRVGRFPGVIYKLDAEGNKIPNPDILNNPDEPFITVPYWTGVIMSTNPPSNFHWWYELAEVLRPKRYEFFTQPAPIMKDKEGEWVRNPKGENLQFLKGGAQYYLDMMQGKDKQFIDVYILGNYGQISHGLPVYPMFNEEAHVSDQLELMKNVPIIAGVDLGFNAAVVFGQVMPNGTLNILTEIYQENITTRDFIQNYVKPHLVNHYAGMTIEWFVDPSGMTRTSTDGGNDIQEYMKAGISVQPCVTNSVSARVQAVSSFLNRRNGMKVDRGCVMVVGGLRGEFVYERVMVAQERYKDKPDKGKFSHTCVTGDTMVAQVINGFSIWTQITVLNVGDYVETPLGACMITATMNRMVEKTLELEFSNGNTVRCTKDHPFITTKGIVEAKDLCRNDVFIAINYYKEVEKWEGLKNTLYENLITLNKKKKGFWGFLKNLTTRKKSIVRLVGYKFIKEETRVYDLTVDNAHVFFTNGLLSANCDALSYLCISLDPSYANKTDYKKRFEGRKKPPKKWGI